MIMVSMAVYGRGGRFFLKRPALVPSGKTLHVWQQALGFYSDAFGVPRSTWQELLSQSSPRPSFAYGEVGCQEGQHKPSWALVAHHVFLTGTGSEPNPPPLSLGYRTLAWSGCLWTSSYLPVYAHIYVCQYMR